MNIEYNHEASTIFEAVGFSGLEEFREHFDSGFDKLRLLLKSGTSEVTPEELRALITDWVIQANKQGGDEGATVYLATILDCALPGRDLPGNKLSRIVEIIEMIDETTVLALINARFLRLAILDSEGGV